MEALTEDQREELVRRFEITFATIQREGADRLLDYIRQSDFYTAPASTRFHSSIRGGLLLHSLNVYERLMEKAESAAYFPEYFRKAGITDESIAVIALLHDICKTHFYTQDFKNQKSYDPEKVKKAERYQVKYDSNGAYIWETVQVFAVDDKVPYGHGEKSVMMIEEFMRLKPLERYAIRWHMGFPTDPDQSRTFKQTWKQHF